MLAHPVRDRRQYRCIVHPGRKIPGKQPGGQRIGGKRHVGPMALKGPKREYDLFEGILAVIGSGKVLYFKGVLLYHNTV